MTFTVNLSCQLENSDLACRALVAWSQVEVIKKRFWMIFEHFDPKVTIDGRFECFYLHLTIISSVCQSHTATVHTDMTQCDLHSHSQSQCYC